MAEVEDRQDEIGAMNRALQTLQEHVCSMMQQVAESSQQVAQSAAQLTNSSEQSATVSGQVADSIVNVAASCSEQFTEVENAFICFSIN
jgi:methyl-accepting chemotaxis protein